MMPVTSGRMELWRRFALLLGILVGLAMFFYVAPAMISVTAVYWETEQSKELKSPTGLVTEERKRLSQLPMNEYIQAKTRGKVVVVDSGQWGDFFTQVQIASNGQYGSSTFGNRVSEEDIGRYWGPTGPVRVFFKPQEIPYAKWGLREEDGSSTFVSTLAGGQPAYFRLDYCDYTTSVGAMSSPYRVAPGWLYHPYRTLGVFLMVAGLMLYVLLPRLKKQPDEIGYSRGSMLAGDLMAVILLLPFYGLPYLINGGTTQAFTGLWPITVVMWFLVLFVLVILYYNAWYASYRIEITPEAIYIISFKGIRKCSFDNLAAVNIVTLRNPGWFRKLFLGMAALTVLGGRGSTQPVGSAVLAATASYGGIEIREKSGGKPVYIWVTNQMGGVIINNIARVLDAIADAGVLINKEPREIEGFSMFM